MGWRAAPSRSSPSRRRRRGSRRRSRASRASRRRGASGCWWSRTTRPSAFRSSSCSATTTSTCRRAATGAEALAAMREPPPDCVVLDLRLPDMTGFEVLEQHAQRRAALRDLPVVVFTGKELSPDEERRLQSMARSIVVKGVESPERLLDETALFLHRVVADLPPEKQAMLERLLTLRRGPGRPAGARRRRRRAQHLRALERARAARHGRADRDHGPGRDRHAAGQARHRDRADGHHDAGDGRLRDDARDPQSCRRSGACRSSRSPPRR